MNPFDNGIINTNYFDGLLNDIIFFRRPFDELNQIIAGLQANNEGTNVNGYVEYVNELERTYFETKSTFDGNTSSRETLLSHGVTRCLQLDDYINTGEISAYRTAARSLHCLTEFNKAIKQGREIISPTPAKQQITFELIYTYLKNKDWMPRFNEITRTVEINQNAIDKMRLDKSPDNAVSNFFNRIYDDLKSLYTGVTADYVRTAVFTIITSGEHSRVYNPILEHLQQLDKRTPADIADKISELCTLMRIPQNDTLSRTLIHKWLIQAIAIQYNGKDDNSFGLDGVLVLNGKQGIGKSRLIAALAKPFSKHTGALIGGGSIRTSEKDSIIQATNKFLFEIAEIEHTFNRSDMSALKEFITRSHDELRLPYAAAAETHHRHTSYIADCNTDDYLRDTTGNRRFWTIPLTESFDFTGIDKFDFNLLWLQAYRDMHRNGLHSFRLTADEQAQLADRNGDHLQKISAQQEIEDIFAHIAENPEKFKEEYTTVSRFMREHDLSRYSAVVVGKAIRTIYAAQGKELLTKSVKQNGIPVKAVLLPMLRQSN